MSICNIYPFDNFRILPAYGPNTARIIWSVSSPIFNKNSCTIKFQKSKDGYTDWFDLDMIDPINNTPITIDDGVYLDKKLGRYNQTVEWHYRAIVTENKSGKVHQTSAITYRHNLTDLEFGTIREILSLEYNNPDTIWMFLLRPTTVKNDPMNLENLSSVINPLTGQVIGRATDEEGFGKTYGNATSEIKAFSKPILVQLTIKQNSYKQLDLEGGHGSYDNTEAIISSFNYPKFIKGDLLIDPINDQRYLFDQVTAVSEFKGIIPLTFQGKMTLLSRNDPMYNYKLPECAIEYLLGKKRK